MPGVVAMDNGGVESSFNDHGKATKMNGINGTVGNAVHASAESTQAPHEGDRDANKATQLSERSTLYPSRMNDLPDEIVHITQGFVPLATLLTRLAQVTHNSLQGLVTEMAKLPMPSAVSNGLSSHSSSGDDITPENLLKKQTLLNFAQDFHAKWVKALVITEWSRKTDKVSKLIDLKFHIDQQRLLFDVAVDTLVNVKRDLSYARMPSPDLKTALQTLSTGSAPWMPDMQYIEPPPLSADEQLKWLNDLDILLSLRLNLEEFDKIPPQFQDYQIGSGRVKFRVKGEFEVDLTIADEDFEKQFWFIDFRFDFKPATPFFSDSFRNYLEGCVNGALAKDGLGGCYQFLHEYVLTCKINELKRQALQMSKKAWTGTLTVEPLNRALAIQYWTSRTPTQGSKSWVLIAVNSGRKGTSLPAAKSTSYLEARWYRDNKEVEDFQVRLDGEHLSVQDLLRRVIGKHIEFLLRGVHAKLLGASRFKNREAGMLLNISETDPTLSSLTTQIGYKSSASLLIEPRTGSYVLKPHSKFTIQFEHQLNNTKDPINDGAMSLESVRCAFIEDEIHRSGNGAGWQGCRPQMTPEELQSITKKRALTKTLWLKQEGWGPHWFVVVCLSLGGDEWWLVDTRPKTTSTQQQFHARLPFSKGHPNLTDDFWYTLTLLSSGMIAQSVDLRELHQNQVKHFLSEAPESTTPSRIRMPAITLELSAIFPHMVLTTDGQSKATSSSHAVLPGQGFALAMSLSPKQPWADNLVTIDFQGAQVRRSPEPAADLEATEPRSGKTTRPLICVTYATISVRKPAKLKSLNGKIDRDVSYSSTTGKFRVRMRHPVGTSTLSAFKSRVLAIDRFVSFLEALDEAKGTIKSHSATLNEVSCFYRAPLPPSLESASAPAATSLASTANNQWKVVLDLSGANIQVKLDSGNPHLKAIDLVNRLVNMDGGIKVLMVWLPSSLPALSAINEIESKWEDIVSRAEGNVKFTMRALDWMGVQYSFAAKNTSGQQVSRHLRLDLRLRVHAEEAWWHLCRPDEEGTEDLFSAALKSIWDGKGEDWQGLSTGAAGKLSGGVGKMLHALDDVLRDMVGSIPVENDTTDVPEKVVKKQPPQQPAPPRPNAQRQMSSSKKAGKVASQPITID